MNCLTEQGRLKVEELSKLYPSINREILEQLVREESFAGLDKIPGTQDESYLFYRLSELFGNNTAAAEKAAVVLATYFLHKDDYDNNLLITSSGSLPSLFYTIKNSNIAYDDMSQVYYNYIKEELERINDPDAQTIATSFKNAYIKGDIDRLKEYLKLLQVKNIVLPEIQVGFSNYSNEPLYTSDSDEYIHILECETQGIKILGTILFDPVLKEINPSKLTIELNKGLQEVVNLAINAYKSKTRGNNIGIISGKAGTGKTTICQEIIKQLETEKPLNIIVSAVSNAAKNNILDKIGKTKSRIQGLSVAGLLGKVLTYDQDGNEVWKDDDQTAKQRAKIRAAAANLVIVDEASMLSQEIIDEIKSFCPNALILFVGDERQVRPVTEKIEIFAPIFNSKGLFNYELKERVRQGEGSPILNVSDIYGDISSNPEESEKGINRQVLQITTEIDTPHKEIQKDGAIFSIPENSPEVVTEFLTPLAIQAIETGNPNLFGIVPYHRNTTTKFNNLIRAGILRNKYGIEASTNPADGINYVGNIPYKKGEIIFANGNIDLGDFTIDNGTKFIVKEDALLANPEEFVIELNGYQILLDIQRVKVQWKENGKINEITLLQPLASSENYVKGYLKLLVNLANQLKTREGARPYWREYFSVKKQFADLKPAWALNVHRAQGQTYEVTYVPAEDYKLGHAEAIKRGESPREALVALSSQLYTAITRASNVVMVSNKNITEIAYLGNVAELNNQIKQFKSIPQSTSPIDVADNSVISERAGNIPEKLLKQYDFLKFVTGSDLLFKSLNTQEGIEEARNLALLFQQREAELNKLGRTFGQVLKNESGIWDYAALLRNKDILRRRITEDNIETIELEELGLFPRIENLNVKAAQAVISPIYAKTFKIGNRTLAEITPEFFKTVNNYYRTKVQHTDLLVRLHNGTLNIAFVDKFPPKHIHYGSPIKPIIINGWRVDEKGNKMYQVPVDKDGKTNFVIYSTGNKETIVFKKNSAYNDSKTLLYSLGDAIVSVLPFLENVSEVEEINKFIKLSNTVSRFTTQEKALNLIRYNTEMTAKQKKDALMSLYDNPEQEKLYLDKFANTLYNSFVKSLAITASRIPTQALASYMNMQVAAFNPSGANDVFVSLWQLWLQGSDLDIDKSFMMGHSYNSIGLFNHWSSIADYSTLDKLKISDQLSIPNGLQIGLDIFISTAADDKWNQLLTIYVQAKDDTEIFRAVKDCINLFNKTKQIHIPETLLQDWNIKQLISKINKHNASKITAELAKNISVDSIIDVCSDVRNIQSAHSPIDRATTRIKLFLGSLEAGMVGDELDEMSIYQLLEDNQTGKKVVGVMANALKVFLTVTQYYNQYYTTHKEIDVNDPSYFLNQISINGKIYNFSSIANTLLEENLIKGLRKALETFVPIKQEILRTNDDVSIILSALVTLATDNAKELALAKLHASLNLASMHTYLAMMGVPIDDIIEYTAKSQLFKDLYDLTKANSWVNQTGNITEKVWKLLKERAINYGKYSINDVELLKRLHSWAAELRSFASLLGINQGMKSGIAQAIMFNIKFQDLIKDERDKFSDVVITSLKAVIDNNKFLDPLILQHGLLPTQALRSYYNEKIKAFVDKYGDIRIGDELINYHQYFNDENYREKMVALYDIFKQSINILDVINHSPHFYEMLKSLSTIILKISKSAKGKFLMLNFVENFKPNAIINIDKLPLSINEVTIKEAQRFFDDYVISDFISGEGSRLMNFGYSVLPSENIFIKKLINLSTANGILLFKEAFDTLIARLRQKDNPCINSLVTYEDKYGRLLYKLNFNLDTLNRENAGEQQLKYNEIVGGFNQIKDLPVSQIFAEYIAPDGRDEVKNPVTVGDMFFIYNLIFNLGARGLNSLTALLDSYISESKEDSPVVNYYQTVISYDLGDKLMELNSDLFNAFIFRSYSRDPENKVIARSSSTDNGVTYSPKENVLANIQIVENNVKTIAIYHKFLLAIRDGILQIDLDENC